MDIKVVGCEDMVTMRNFNFIFDKFEIAGICIEFSRGSYAKKCVTKSCN
jgi:hypothetical protein